MTTCGFVTNFAPYSRRNNDDYGINTMYGKGARLLYLSCLGLSASMRACGFASEESQLLHGFCALVFLFSLTTYRRQHYVTAAPHELGHVRIGCYSCGYGWVTDALKYKSSLATPLASVVAVAVAADSDTCPDLWLHQWLWLDC